MTECLGESDVKELAESTLAGFDQEVASLPQELCVPFNQAAMRLEGELLTIYKFVVRIVRREEDLEKIARWWGTMVTQWADFFYDRVLDLRNKCQRLRQMHS
jgi:hypothetical protein